MLLGEIRVYSVLPTLSRQFVFVPFLFQQENVPEHKASGIKTGFPQFGMEELESPALSPDLNPVLQVWDELEPGLSTRPYDQHHC